MKNHSYISMQQDMPDQGQLQVTVLDSASNRPVKMLQCGSRTQESRIM